MFQYVNVIFPGRRFGNDIRHLMNVLTAVILLFQFTNIGNKLP